MSGLLAIALALAWDHDPPRTFEVGGTVLGIDRVPWGGELALLTLTDAELVAWNLDGERVATTAGGAHIRVVDLDGDGREELLRCGAAGLQLIPTAGGAFGRAHGLSDIPCLDLTVDASERWPALVIRGPDGFVRIAPDPDGVLFTEPLELTLDGEVALAWADDAVAFGQRGARTLVLHTGGGVGVLPLGGPLVDMAGDGDGLAWVVAGERPAALRGRVRIPLPEPPVRVELVDLDLDGHSELWVAGAHAWLHPAVDPELPVGEAFSVDLEGDGFGDLVVAEGTRLHLVRGRGGDLGPVTLPLPDEAPPPAPVEEVVFDDDADGWPPREWIAGRRLAHDQLPAPAPVHLSGGDWPETHVFAGASVVIPVDAGPRRLIAVEGPPTLVLRAGRVEYDAPLDDIGRWYVSVKRSPGVWEGFVLNVWPRPGPGDPVPGTP